MCLKRRRRTRWGGGVARERRRRKRRRRRRRRRAPVLSRRGEDGDEEEEEEDGGEGGGRCRWGALSPQCCQKWRRAALMLVCLCWAGATQGVVVNGFVNVVISTVERRFEMSSTESGIIASCYDIAAVLLLIPLTYFGGRGRKPVYLSLGMLVLGIGSFVFSIPHFATGLYSVGQAEDSVCSGSNGSVCDDDGGGGGGDASLSNFRFVFYLGQLLHGAGATPLYTLGTTYLDDNLPVASTSLYQGIFYAFAILGPGIGYLAGGALLNIFTDFDKVGDSQLTINRENPRWVGAWWLGFLIGGILALSICVPLFGFPKSLPGAEEYKAEKEKEVYKGKDEGQKATDSQPLGVQHILTSLRYLVTNPTFMFLNMAAATEGIIVSGFSTFAPKFVEFQFSLTSASSAQYIGLVAIPAAGGATFLGGWLVKRFGWDVRQILKFCVWVTAVTECLILIFLIQCDSMPFAGISVQYQQQSSPNGGYLGGARLDAGCNAGCGCSMEDYNPVCGRDNVMYYSPCYAGCSGSFAGDSSKYTNCSCVMYNYTAEDVAQSRLWMVQEGKCDSDCPFLIPFLAVFGLVMIGIFVTSMPALSASLRCVAQDQRSFALGIQWIIARCLGSIPGPILMGKIIDITCLVWQQSCKGDGACFYYDNKAMSLNILGLGLGFNFLSICFFLLALLCYRSVGVGALEAELVVPSHNTSMTTITQPPTPSAEYPAHGVTVGTQPSAVTGSSAKDSSASSSAAAAGVPPSSPSSSRDTSQDNGGPPPPPPPPAAAAPPPPPPPHQRNSLQLPLPQSPV
ncbi:solute carrier organic anion transporter family member 4A1-like [Babylonia areolata]|uniref:solute carrier organic anion transporter family member 4A1-like n=1 Tax=Babylonia areolata TaxID=304850 RepID=UPI003FD3310E